MRPLPMVPSLEALDGDLPVTSLVGENASGKSTLLEAAAAARDLAGAKDVLLNPTLAP